MVHQSPSSDCKSALSTQKPSSNFFKADTTKIYSFTGQEQLYNKHRPKWPKTIAKASLEKVGYTYNETTRQWLNETNNPVDPVIVCIGSGPGADVKPFLELGCKVYAVEPNPEFRNIAEQTLSKSYQNRFVNVDGKAHQLNLPSGLKADLMVCAQALHSFNSGVTKTVNSEETARTHWKTFLPDDNKNRLAIWYYNLDPAAACVLDLDKVLKDHSETYRNSQSPLVDAVLFEPSLFQYYIDAKEMYVSNAQHVNKVTVTLDNLSEWLGSYSFCPKSEKEKESLLFELKKWFERNDIQQTGKIELPYVGFISQGPVRSLSYVPSNQVVQASPIRAEERKKSLELSDSFWSNQTTKKSALLLAAK